MPKMSTFCISEKKIEVFREAFLRGDIEKPLLLR